MAQNTQLNRVASSKQKQNGSAAWFKNATIYGINIGTFQDGDGDGIGDFQGLTNRLDYLANLGVDCLWLLPFYPSPKRDNGYDVSDYFGVDPRYGTIDDFREFVQEAKARGIRVIIDLVVHHTSDKHPWFEAAKADRHSMYRDYYVWSDKLPKVETEQSFFPEVESGVWRFDPVSKSYYHHGFYHFQPDLNFANERVQDEVLSIVDFWLSFEVSGFRLDAAGLLIGQKGLPHTEVVDPSKFWQRIRKFIDERQPDAVMLAEADMGMDRINDFVMNGKGIHMLLNFWTNQTAMYALATGDVGPWMQTISELPKMPDGAQYVNFLRNLDEFNVRLMVPLLTSTQQKEVYKALGPRKNMQVYGRGIRRRLAPMLEGNIARIKMAFSLLFSMPGAPMFVYGDEIGMGDNLRLPERDSVRTPMQWDNIENGGFSIAGTSEVLYRTVTDPRYNYQRINVEDQLDDPQSLLNFMKMLIKVRKECSIIGLIDFTPIHTNQTNVAVLKYQDDSSSLVILNNLGGKPVEVKLKESGILNGLHEILSDSEEYPMLEDDCVTLNAYGFRWFRNA